MKNPHQTGLIRQIAKCCRICQGFGRYYQEDTGASGVPQKYLIDPCPYCNGKGLDGNIQ